MLSRLRLASLDLREERDPLELVHLDETSPSSSGTSCSGGSSGAPEGSVVDRVVEYVHEGCNVGSLKSSEGSCSRVRGRAIEAFFDCVVLWLVSGRPFLDGFNPLAFFRPEVHHSSRSSMMELLELSELLSEGAPELLDLSLAILCLLSPTFSESGSTQDRSAENILDGDRKEKGGRRPEQIKL
jgi:hypothetical protein